MKRLTILLAMLALCFGAVWLYTGGDLEQLRGVTRDRVEEAPIIPTHPEPGPDTPEAADRAAAVENDSASQAEAAAEAAIAAADEAVARAQREARIDLEAPAPLPDIAPTTALDTFPPSTSVIFGISSPPDGQASSDTNATIRPQADSIRQNPALSVEGFDAAKAKALIRNAPFSEAQKATLISLISSAASNPALLRSALEQIKAALS